MSLTTSSAWEVSTRGDGIPVEFTSADKGQDRSLRRLSTPDGTDRNVGEFLPRMSSAVAPAQQEALALNLREELS
jgi:hypothetical protein